MQSLHLTSYIASPLFLEELQKQHLPYDALLTDITYENSPLPLCDLLHKPAQQSLLPFRAEAVEKAQQPLIILGQLPLSFVQPLLDKFPTKAFTIINLYVGMGSLGRKLKAELEDLPLLPAQREKYEPLDVVNVFSILEQPFTKYLRIPHLHFPESIFSTSDIAIIDKEMKDTINILSLKGYGYAGDNGTLLATGANFSSLLQLGDILQAEGKGMELFVISKLTAEGTEELRSSLHRTKKLILLIDHLPSPALQERITTRLEKAGLTQISIQYLTPAYEKLTTIFDEFSAEQADFSADKLGKRLE
jgi:hypothetical protein